MRSNSKISCKLTSLHVVCDAPIARTTAVYVPIKDIGRRLPFLEYLELAAGQQGDVNQSVHGFLTGTKPDGID